MDLNTLNSLADDFILAPNDAPKYVSKFSFPSTQKIVKDRDAFVKYWYCANDTVFFGDEWLATPEYGNYSDRVLYAKYLDHPDPSVNMFKWRVYDEPVFGNAPISAGFFDLSKGEYTGPNPEAAKDNVNWMNFLPKDIWIFRLPEEYNYGKVFVFPDGVSRPHVKTVFYLDMSWNGFKKNQDLGVAWGIPCPVDPRAMHSSIS